MIKKELLYKKMYRIRRFEELALELARNGLTCGTVHVCIGQEANAVGVLENTLPQDTILSTHRCHGHYLAAGGNMLYLLKEIIGHEEGLCAGRGGSQHICDKRFFSSGIQGGLVPIGLGMAYAEKIKKTKGVVIVFIGDGTFGQGVVYEALNMIALYKVPLLIVVENNRYAQSTHIDKNMAGSIRQRVEAFGLPVDEIESSDVVKLESRYKEIILRVRSDKEPSIGIINTYRLGPHGASFDTRPKEYLNRIKKYDPLGISVKCLDRQALEGIHEEVDTEIKSLLVEAEINYEIRRELK